MRTTITLDDDLNEVLKRRAHEQQLPFKQVVNETLRAGLMDRPTSAKPYRMKPSDMGVRPFANLTKALDLASELEDSEIVRKLEQGR